MSSLRDKAASRIISSSGTLPPWWRFGVVVSVAVGAVSFGFVALRDAPSVEWRSDKQLGFAAEEGVAAEGGFVPDGQSSGADAGDSRSSGWGSPGSQGDVLSSESLDAADSTEGPVGEEILSPPAASSTSLYPGTATTVELPLVAGGLVRAPSNALQLAQDAAAAFFARRALEVPSAPGFTPSSQPPGTSVYAVVESFVNFADLGSSSPAVSFFFVAEATTAGVEASAAVSVAVRLVDGFWRLESLG